MSITSALSSALTGITATSRQAEIVSSNVANATTPGYARREVQLSARVLGGTGQGVAVTGVTRSIDQYLINERRLAAASDSDRKIRSEFMTKVEAAIGTPETEGSLGSRIAALEKSLVEASSRPESEARLAVVANAARSLASGLGTITRDIQLSRSNADRQIASEVDVLNSGLKRVSEINVQLRSFSGTGLDVSALLDQRQQIIDKISAIVPLREVSRGQNQIALFTTGGATLLDGPAAQFSFQSTNTITAEMSLSLGGLSGLAMNGRDIATGGATSPILGGRLGALFSVRDELAVTAQKNLDAVARDLTERFSAPGPDPTLAPGDPGLFTDFGTAFLPINESGLAGRITLSAAVDPKQGGDLFRLRDGLQAAGPGPSGNNGLLKGLLEALTAPRQLTSSSFVGGSRNFSQLAGDILSGASTERLSADGDASFSAVRLTALEDMEKQGGVDTDQEMQMLLVIEKNYAANAKVIQTVNDMIDTLLGL